jgi:hypothetical protein
MSGLDVGGSILVAGLVGIIVAVRRKRYWGTASLWLPMGLGVLAVGFATESFWFGIAAGVLAPLAASQFLIRGEELYDFLSRRFGNSPDRMSQAPRPRPGDNTDTVGMGLTLGIGVSALLLAISGLAESPSMVAVSRGVLFGLLTLACWLAFRRAGERERVT